MFLHGGAHRAKKAARRSAGNTNEPYNTGLILSCHLVKCKQDASCAAICPRAGAGACLACRPACPRDYAPPFRVNTGARGPGHAWRSARHARGTMRRPFASILARGRPRHVWRAARHARGTMRRPFASILARGRPRYGWPCSGTAPPACPPPPPCRPGRRPPAPGR